MAAILMRFPGGRRKAFTLSYDDGTVFDKRLVETIERYGVKATLNINTEGIGKSGNKLSKEELIALAASSSVEIAAHGYRHHSLASVESGVATYDVIKDREVLETMLGKIVRGMAYANGSVSDSVVEILRGCGIEYSRTTVSTEKFELPTDWLRLPATCHHNNPRLMELAREFVEKQEEGYVWRNRPMLFFVWGHSHEFDRDGNWEVLDELCEYVGGRDEIWYATNGEICLYLKAVDALRWSHDQSIVHNPTAADVFLSNDGKPFTVPAGATVRL